MRVLIVNGSPKDSGNTATAIDEMVKEFDAAGVESEIIQIGAGPMQGCTSCGKCWKQGKCVFDDIVNETAAKLADADGLVLASPVYYASANGSIVAFLDRLFYSTGKLDKTMKVGASLAVARRGGTTSTCDELNKYFGISGMPVASSNYWSIAYGAVPGQVSQDTEGIQTIRVLAKNMIFLMKSIALGKEKYGLPESERKIMMNFIR